MYILYKMNVYFKKEMGYTTILKYVKNCREVVDPNSGFIKQIKNFEEMMKTGEI